MEANATPTPVAVVREELGLSREAMARKIDVASVTVEKWERRERFPSRKNRQKLSLLSGRPATYFDDTDMVAA
jgi:DNA-binding transcriptional regulator YiaG